MRELDRMLTELGREFDWPATPDLAGRVAERLRAPAGPSRPATRARTVTRARPRLGARGLLGLRRSLVLAVVALVLLAGTVVAAVPGVRERVLELFGLQGATVERRESLPVRPPERPLELGRRVQIEDARGRLGFRPLLPSDPGPPEAAYVNARTPGGELSLAYDPRPGLPRASSTGLGLLVGEFRGDLAPEYTGKIAGQTTSIERLRVEGRRALWIAGAPHLFFYRTPDGGFGEADLRLAENVLLVEHGPLLIRLEGGFGRERAVEIARSLSPAR
jgi:hypothetical protein